MSMTLMMQLSALRRYDTSFTSLLCILQAPRQQQQQQQQYLVQLHYSRDAHTTSRSLHLLSGRRIF